MRRLASLFAVLAMAWGLAAPHARAAEKSFALIAAPGLDEHRLNRESAAMIFRRKLIYWSNGQRIQPVNLPPAHPLRRTFSLSLLGQAPEAMEDYWREMYFHGVRPPHVLASEEAVALFVASTPGAIGYVSACPPDSKVSVLLVVGEVPGCGAAGH